MRTIRGRLAFGFGVTVVLVAAIAALAVNALRTGNAGNAQALESVEQEFEGSQRVITAALREIASGVVLAQRPRVIVVAVDERRVLVNRPSPRRDVGLRAGRPARGHRAGQGKRPGEEMSETHLGIVRAKLRRL